MRSPFDKQFAQMLKRDEWRDYHELRSKVEGVVCALDQFQSDEDYSNDELWAKAYSLFLIMCNFGGLKDQYEGNKKFSEYEKMIEDSAISSALKALLKQIHSLYDLGVVAGIFLDVGRWNEADERRLGCLRDIENAFEPGSGSVNYGDYANKRKSYLHPRKINEVQSTLQGAVDYRNSCKRDQRFLTGVSSLMVVTMGAVGYLAIGAAISVAFTPVGIALIALSISGLCLFGVAAGVRAKYSIYNQMMETREKAREKYDQSLADEFKEFDNPESQSTGVNTSGLFASLAKKCAYDVTQNDEINFPSQETLNGERSVVPSQLGLRAA